MMSAMKLGKLLEAHWLNIWNAITIISAGILLLTTKPRRSLSSRVWSLKNVSGILGQDQSDDKTDYFPLLAAIEATLA